MKSFISFVLRKHPSTFVPATRYTFLPISALEKWTVVSFAAARAGVTQRSPSQETKRTGIAVLWQWPSSFISFVLRKHSPWGHLGWFSSTFVPQRAVSLCSKRSRDRAKEFFRLTRRRKNSFVRSNFQYFNFPILRDPILFPFTGRDLMYTHHESPVRNWMVRWCYLMVHWIIRNRQASIARRGTNVDGCLQRTKLMKLFMWLIHIFIRWPAEETSIGLINVSLNGDSFSRKAAFAHLLCPIFDNKYNLRNVNVLPDYQRYSG